MIPYSQNSKKVITTLDRIKHSSGAPRTKKIIPSIPTRNYVRSSAYYDPISEVLGPKGAPNMLNNALDQTNRSIKRPSNIHVTRPIILRAIIMLYNYLVKDQKNVVELFCLIYFSVIVSIKFYFLQLIQFDILGFIKDLF